MFTECLSIIVLQFSLTLCPLLPLSTVEATQQGSSGFKVREPNLHTPDLFADNLDFVATLVNLPGATKKESYWELSYQLYFVPEEKYYEAIKRLPRGPSNPPPEHFHGRIFLAEGRQKKTRLATLEDRTIRLTGIPFKQKIPDAQRTKFSYLLTAYSVKIFDAQLHTTVYRSGIFLGEPYEENPHAVARKAVYLNFSVTPDGTLNFSQLARKPGETKW